MSLQTKSILFPRVLYLLSTDDAADCRSANDGTKLLISAVPRLLEQLGLYCFEGGASSPSQTDLDYPKNVLRFVQRTSLVRTTSVKNRFTWSSSSSSVLSKAQPQWRGLCILDASDPKVVYSLSVGSTIRRAINEWDQLR